MPAGLFKKTLDQVEKAKEDRRMAKTAAIRKEYDDNPNEQFELTTAQRPTVAKVQEAKDRAERRLQSEVNFAGPKAKRVPDFDNQG